MTAPPLLRLSGVGKAYGGVAAVRPTDLDVARGDFCAILGPSGCGKSTLLRMIAGFVAPTTGRIDIDGKDVTALRPERRPANIVFQSYGLFPHMNVAENVAFGPSVAKRPREEIARRVAEALALVRLEGFGDRPIDRLSGGQQQRVALARALVMRPLILLLDEPLSALDLKLRQAMQEELRRIHREIGGTFLFVTHDQSEAFHLANRIVVMEAGRIEQVGTPDEIYRAPRTLFVAGFVGEANVLRGRREGGRVRLEAGAELDHPGADGPVSLILRPEAMRPGAADGPGVSATVADVIYLGPLTKILLELLSGERITLHDADPSARERWRPGLTLGVGWSEADQRVVDGG